MHAATAIFLWWSRAQLNAPTRKNTTHSSVVRIFNKHLFCVCAARKRLAAVATRTFMCLVRPLALSSRNIDEEEN